MLIRCQAPEHSCSHRELDSLNARQPALPLSRPTCADHRELGSAAASPQALDLPQRVGISGSELEDTRLQALQLSRRACGLALGASLLALQAAPAHAVLTAPPGGCSSLLPVVVYCFCHCVSAQPPILCKARHTRC